MIRSPLPQNRKTSLDRRRGFTLIETLVRIGIIMILSALLANYGPLKSAREAAARFNGPHDLEDLCEAVAQIIRDGEGPVPTTLAEIEPDLPERFEVVTEGKGNGVDVAANGFRYHLEVPLRFQGEHWIRRSPYLNPREHVTFLVQAIPSSTELINSEFYVVHRPDDPNSCAKVRVFNYDESRYRDRRDQFLIENGFRFLYESFNQQVSPQDLASLVREIRPEYLQQIVERIDTNNDQMLTLKELADLQDLAIVGSIVQHWVDHYAIGKYGEQIDQIGVAVDMIQFDDRPPSFLTEYDALKGMLDLEAPDGRGHGIVASAIAAQQAADKSDRDREEKQIAIIRQKSDGAWLNGDISDEAYDFIEYSLQFRQAYLDEDAP